MALQGVNSVRRKVKRIQRDLKREIDDAVDQGLESTEDGARSRLVGSGRVVSGELASAFAVTSVSIGPGATRHRLVNRALYAKYIEFGTGSRWGTSPFDMFFIGMQAPPRRYKAPALSDGLKASIIKWVMTRPIFIGERSTATAYKIARSISELGTHPHPFLRPAWFTVAGPGRGIRNTSPFGQLLRNRFRRVIKYS